MNGGQPADQFRFVGRKPIRCQYGQGILKNTFIADSDMSGANLYNVTREALAKEDKLLDVAI